MSFKTDAEKKFEDCSRDVLAKYCDLWELEYKPQHGAPALRKLLLAELKSYHEVVQPAPGEAAIQVQPIPEHKQLSAAELIGLNLRSQGHWQGKRRKITLQRALEYESTVFPHFFGWEGLHCYVPFGVQADIPYTVWNILQEANSGKQLIRQRRVDADGRIYYQEKWVAQQRFMLVDHGVTPGTEHLPEDIRDQVRMMWHKTNSFDGYSATQLRQLCRMLRLTVRDDWKAPDMKAAMKRLIGLSELSELATPAARTAAKT